MKSLLRLVLGNILLCLCLSANCQDEFIIIGENEPLEITGKQLGSVNFKDKGFTVNCSYAEVIAILKKKAEDKGGNLLKIREHKQPDDWSSCHRIIADVYYVENTSQYQKEIQWNASRKLNWTDFKAAEKPAELQFSNIAACTYCGFGFETNRVTVFKKSKFFVYNRFYCDQSWGSEHAKTSDKVLLHEQKHFDLSEIYARKLFKELTAANLTVANLDEANSIFNVVYDEYRKRQEAYDGETQHGLDSDSQSVWNDIISKELEELSEYKKYN